MIAQREILVVPGAAPLELFRLAGPAPGPALALFGGVHGDEPEGVFAANAIARGDIALTRGSLVVVPVAHPAAFAADTRTSPDGTNLARVFPGSPDGTPGERTAAALTTLLDAADALIDLHTAGRHYAMPLLAGYVDNAASARSREMAEWFSADFVWRHPGGGKGRTLSVMAEAGKPAIYTEAPGRGTLDGPTLQRYIDGVKRVMAGFGMIDSAPDATVNPKRVAGSGNMDTDVILAPRDGFFSTLVDAGDQVEAGQPIGRLLTLEAGETAVAAPQAGVVMYLRQTARIGAGTALVAFAAEDDAA